MQRLFHVFLEEFCDACMRQELAKAVLARLNVDGTDLQKIQLLPEQRPFLPDLYNESTSTVPGGMDNEESNLNFGSMITAIIGRFVRYFCKAARGAACL